MTKSSGFQEHRIDGSIVRYEGFVGAHQGANNFQESIGDIVQDKAWGFAFCSLSEEVFSELRVVGHN